MDIKDVPNLFLFPLRPGDPPEYGYLYAIPAAALLGGYITTAMQVIIQTPTIFKKTTRV